MSSHKRILLFFLILVLIATLCVLVLLFGIGENTPQRVSSSHPHPSNMLVSPSILNYHTYIDPITRVTIDLPDPWTTVVSDQGRLAVFQSYPEGKYLGGESFLPGDTKCDLMIFPQGTSLDAEARKLRNGKDNQILSEEEFLLQGEYKAFRFHNFSEFAGEHGMQIY